MTHQQQTAFENIVGKEEIAHNEQCLLFPQCFLLNQIIVSPFVHIFDIISVFAGELEEPKIDMSGKGLKPPIQPRKQGNKISGVCYGKQTKAFPKQALFFTCLLKTLWKRRHCLKQAMSHFSTVFSTILENFLRFSSNLKSLSDNSFRLEESKIYCWERVKELLIHVFLGQGYLRYATCRAKI